MAKNKKKTKVSQRSQEIYDHLHGKFILVTDSIKLKQDIERLDKSIKWCHDCCEADECLEKDMSVMVTYNYFYHVVCQYLNDNINEYTVYFADFDKTIQKPMSESDMALTLEKFINVADDGIVTWKYNLNYIGKWQDLRLACQYFTVKINGKGFKIVGSYIPLAIEPFEQVVAEYQKTESRERQKAKIENWRVRQEVI